MNTTNNFLLDICNKYFIAGYEFIDNDILIDYFEPLIDSYKKNNLGSLIFKKNGINNINIMVDAHMDEIGIMIKDIHDNGFLGITNIGGIDPITLISQEVCVFGRERIHGIIGIKPPHITSSEDRKKPVKMEHLYIDTGYNKEELKELVRIGDVAAVVRKPIKLKNSCVAGRALDDKAGIAVLYETAKELNKLKHNSNIFLTASTQEEIGLKGAKVSSYNINPDIAVVVDATFGNTPELSEVDSSELGKGPVILVGANAHPKLTKKIIEIAKKYDFKFQYEVEPGRSGTNAMAIQVNKYGVPCIVISIPLRYMHTNVETVCTKDIIEAGRLIARFISELDNIKLEEVLCF